MIDFAVFLHMGNINMWSEILPYLRRISVPYQLYINYIKDMPDNKEEVMKSFKNVVFFYSENKGTDIGPFFLFMDYLRENKITHKWITKIHTKTDNEWRNHMYNALFPDPYSSLSKNLIDKTHIYGSYTYAYDYAQLYWDLKHFDMLGVKVNTKWNKFIEKHPETKDMTAYERNLYIIMNNMLTDPDIPYIDLELYTQLFGEPQKEQTLVPTPFKFTKGMLFLTKLTSRAKYIPGTCFIFRHDIMENKFKNISYKEIYDNLETGKPNDMEIISKTHSWERVLPMLLLMSDNDFSN